MNATAHPLPRPGATPRPDELRERLVRRARALVWLGLGWHLLEATVALGAGAVAGSVALVGFGADSVVEGAAAVILLWRFAAGRVTSEAAERRAQRLVGVSFAAIAIYVAAAALQTLAAGDRPDSSWVGIGLAVAALATMPLLARAKRRVGHRLGSAATVSESRQNSVCAYLAAALLVGLAANAAFAWWWADPAAALVIAAVAGREGVDAWRGHECAECAGHAPLH